MIQARGFQLLRASSLAFEAIKIAGVAYLLYLPWMTWREQGVLKVEPDGRRRSEWQVLRHAVLVNLLNPKLSMFFLAFLPQFIAANDAAPTVTLLLLSAIVVAMTFAVFALYGAFAARIRQHVLAWLRRSFALTFVGWASSWR